LTGAAHPYLSAYGALPAMHFAPIESIARKARSYKTYKGQ
jgi:hypothetical protein